MAKKIQLLIKVIYNLLLASLNKFNNFNKAPFKIIIHYNNNNNKLINYNKIYK